MNKLTVLVIGIVFSLAGLLVATIDPPKAAAVVGSDFEAGRIIDDGVFFNSGTMNTGDIQNFLNAKVPTCDTNGAQMYNSSITRAQYGASKGYPAPYTCLRDYSQAVPNVAGDAYCGGIGGGTKSAADIIFNVSRACGINPQVLLVLLQKEQSLVSDDWPWAQQYRIATGYGCPDTAACDSAYYGYFNQVYNAGRQFKKYIQQPGSFNFAVGRTSHVGYNPNAACGGTNVTIQTQATAALYNYTPYQPNPSALNNLYGTGDACGAYGNRNFWRMFNDWFGSTKVDGFNVGVTDDGSSAQYLIFGGIKQSIPDPETKVAWGLQNTPTVSLSAAYLATIPNGPRLDRLTRLNTSDSTVFFMDGGKRYRVNSQDLLNSWNLNTRAVTNVPPSIFYIPQDGGNLTYSVKKASNPSMYMVDGSNGSGQTILRQYSNPNVWHSWEGDADSYNTISDTFFNTMDNAIGSPLISTKVTNSGTEYQVVNGSRLAQPAPYGSLFPGTAQAISTATVNRLANAGQASYLVRAASENTVYLIDNGTKRAVSNPSVLSAWQAVGNGVRIVNSSFVNLIPTGPTLASYAVSASGQNYVINAGTRLVPPSQLTGAYQGLSPTSITSQLASLIPQASTNLTGFVRGSGTPELYLLDNSGKKRHIDTGDKATLLGAYTTGVTLLPDGLVGTIPTAASPQSYVNDGTNDYLLEGGTKHPVGASVKADWGLSNPQVYTDGTLDRFTVGSAIVSKLRDGSSYYLVKGARGFLTTDVNIATAWGIDDAPQMDQALIRSNMYYYMLTRFVRSSTDNRTFIVDRGQWYNLTNNQFANLGGIGAPVMGLEPANAPNTITDWTNIVVKDSVGKHYVIDGGTKRNFANPIIQNHWTNNGTLNVPTASNGFLNLLPDSGRIERVVKGSEPAVYSAQGATKRHILTSNTYHTYYAPFSQVTNALISAMPSANDIP